MKIVLTEDHHELPKRSAEHVGTCQVCGVAFDRRRYKDGRITGTATRVNTCPSHRWLRRGDLEAGALLVDKTTPYEEDVVCQIFVASFAGGATLDAIAEVMGVSRERVRQIQESALAKIREAGIATLGVNPDDPEERRDGAPRHDEPRGLEHEDTDEEGTSPDLSSTDAVAPPASELDSIDW